MEKMKKYCCDITGNKIEENKEWFKSRRANGEEFIPAFLQFVDENKCIGCGMCLKVCLGNCYELHEKIINGKKKRVAVAAMPKNCFGDCHCHKICPVPGAIICKPKLISEIKKR